MSNNNQIDNNVNTVKNILKIMLTYAQAMQKGNNSGIVKILIDKAVNILTLLNS